MFDRKLILVTCVAAALAPAAFAQTPSKPVAAAAAQKSTTQSAETVPEGGMPTWIKPETPEHRRERLGTNVDPGINPDPEMHFWRFGKSFHIEKYERKWAAYDREEGTVRPMAMVNFAFEVYQQNDKYVWTWVGDPDPQAAQPVTPTAQSPRYSESDLKFLGIVRPQLFPLDPPRNDRTIRFEESSEGLPQTGSFRNSMAIADMNEDGCPDIVLPPQRGGAEGLPAIYLGDCKGHWKGWPATVPHALDYGSVVVSDFNKDGHMDMAFSVHLTGLFVYLGDGKGHFTEASEGLPHDFPTRRLVVADINHDGYPDLVAVTEGPTPRPLEGEPRGPLIALINKNKGKSWKAVNIAPPGATTGGDWLSAGQFNEDGRIDFVIGSIYLGSRDIFYLSKGANEWARLENKDDLIPWGAYFYGNAAGRITSKTHDDAIISYIRYWPGDLDPAIMPRPPLTEATGIDRVSFAKDGTATRYPIARWAGTRPTTGVALADVDGDGNLDIVYTDLALHQVGILLGDGKGGFTRASTEGIALLDLGLYDIKVADLNGDKKPDILVMYESGSSTNAASSALGTTPVASRSGSVHAFLNRGFAKAQTQSKAAK
ncbi:MAG: hypothetical protein QOE68_4284 [Thermoanaerobaculia bacterium]|nr:hypothetical protein [Thermoanaerobaculia bacterium]